MDINEIAKDTYYFSINNNLSGFITNRNAIKCFDQLVSMSEPGESIHLPFLLIYNRVVDKPFIYGYI